MPQWREAGRGRLSENIVVEAGCGDQVVDGCATRKLRGFGRAANRAVAAGVVAFNCRWVTSGTGGVLGHFDFYDGGDSRNLVDTYDHGKTWTDTQDIPRGPPLRLDKIRKWVQYELRGADEMGRYHGSSVRRPPQLLGLSGSHWVKGTPLGPN
jgi:hypothetical protein